MVRISNIKIYEDIKDENLIDLVIKKFKIKREDIINWHIVKKSIDARKKDDIHYNYSINIELENEKNYKHFDKVTKKELPIIRANNIIIKKLL